MNQYFSFVVFALIAAIAVVIYVMNRVAAQKRTQALQLAAQQIGFNFLGEDWRQLRTPQLTTALFNKGHGGRFSNIMTGSYGGFNMSIFDYRYTTGGGKNSHTWTQTVAAFTQGRSLPPFELRPEGVLDRIGDAFVHKDIDFDSHPFFSSRFLLRGSDQGQIRELFSPALLTFIEGLSDSQWHVEGVGTTLLLYHSDSKVEADEIASFRDKTSAIAQGFFTSCGLRRVRF